MSLASGFFCSSGHDANGSKMFWMSSVIFISGSVVKRDVLSGRWKRHLSASDESVPASEFLVRNWLWIMIELLKAVDKIL